jgi:hypothetical protein
MAVIDLAEAVREARQRTPSTEALPTAATGTRKSRPMPAPRSFTVQKLHQVGVQPG